MSDVKYLQDFATKHKIVFNDEGECGLGRECVGLAHGDSWVDHNPYNMESYDPIAGMECEVARETSPENAYHKHDCLAVLGRGDDAIKQLADWVRAIDASGEVDVVDYENGAKGIQAMVSGTYGKAIIVQ